VTPLEREIRRHIAMEGPMPLADYMAICLTHPEHGYYTTRHPIGGIGSTDKQGGDFITAPEVSQMFGELLAVWCMEIWQALGAPTSINLVEIGPGRGTLMRDLLRVSGTLPGFETALNVYLIDVSPTLGEQQDHVLSSKLRATRLTDIDGLPNRPTLVLANELLDALPFRQWCRRGKAWHERAVGLVDDKLTFVLRPNVLGPETLPEDNQTQPDGTIFETALAREAFIDRTADFLSRNSGAALFIDYGHITSSYGDTFQAVRNHAYADPLSAIGLADLTSHVDFQRLRIAAANHDCAIAPITNQGEFLLKLGLLERAGALGAGQSKSVQNDLTQAVHRLAAPEQMGDLFKIMAFGAPVDCFATWPGTPDTI